MELHWNFLDSPPPEAESLPTPEELGKCLTISERAFLSRTAREQGLEAGQALEKRLRSEREDEPQENLLEKHFLANAEEFDGKFDNGETERGWLKRLFQRVKKERAT